MTHQQFTFEHGLAEMGIVMCAPLFFMRQMTCQVRPQTNYRNSQWERDLHFIPDNLNSPPIRATQ